jgi:GMP synthase (glutamine-hydrolysing)
MPHVTVVEHEPGCTVDRLGTWLRGAGCAVEVTRPYAGQPLPDAGDADGLVVLGGQMGAYDDELAPWLPAVRALLADAVDTGTPTLGVCLGAQLLAVACGGRVERGQRGTEGGVVDVRWRTEAARDPLLAGLPDPFPGPSMHDDAIVDLPPDAAWLGETDLYRHQVFRVGEAAWGVQFHPEVSVATFTAWGEHHRTVDAAEWVRQLQARDAEVAAAGQMLAARFSELLRVCAPRSGG